jgi:2-oxoglutarate ferredoxin oxidoreductase subunit beta
MIVEAINKKGFSFVEVISPCPTHFGRLNGMKTAPQMLNWIKENSITTAQAGKLSPEEREKKFIIGKFVDREIEDYSTKYKRIVEAAKSS